MFLVALSSEVSHHGVVTATAVNQRQATHSTSTQGRCLIDPHM